MVIRHAKAEASVPDIARPLTREGRRDARTIGEWLARHAAPDLVVISPAVRARETWECAADGLAAATATWVDDRVYTNTMSGLVEAVRACDESLTTVALVGHNPSVHALAASATRTADVRAEALVTFPTATVAVLTVEGSWSEFEPSRAWLAAVRTCRAGLGYGTR